MAALCEHTVRNAETYRERQEDARRMIEQEGVLREHDRAMLVFELEDLLMFGIYVLASWIRHVTHWHRQVSSMQIPYNPDEHKKIDEIENIAVEASKGTLELVSTAKSWGYDVEHEKEYRALANVVIGAAVRPADQFCDSEFREYSRKAVQEYRTGGAVEIDCWGK